MSHFLTIRALMEEGRATKAIARTLGLNVRTVRKYIRRIRAGETEPRRAKVRTILEACREVIERKATEGLSAVQIYQDLCGQGDFEASYASVRRLVRGLRRSQPEVYCRLQFRPGQEAQIDFGQIGPLEVEGRRRRVHLFAMTLCYSRLSYYELVTDQTVPTFLGAIRRGLEFFGAAPERLKPDNLKSAVLIDQLGQRYYQRDFFDFCRHYGMVPEAARPATPTDKGRTERDIGYVKGSCFRGRKLKTLDEARHHLAAWRDSVANVRLHGTTQRRPVDLFQEERAHLRPLPAEPYELCRMGLYKVRKDCHVHVEGNFYSVPHEHVGRQVLVRVREHQIVISVEDRVLATHERPIERGRTLTDPAHYPPYKRTANQEIHRQRTLALRSAGPHATQFLACLRQGPYVYGDQIARLSKLLEAHGAAALELACLRALYFEATQGARIIERILVRGLHHGPLPSQVLPVHPVPAPGFGRPLAEYEALLSAREVV